MQRLLSRRILRDLKHNLFRYFALFSLIVLGMYLVISIIAAAETIILGVQHSQEVNHVEDGQFSVFVPLKDDEIRLLENKGIIIEKEFYLDYELEDETTVRVYQNREQINLVSLREGSLPKKQGEIVLEQLYADCHMLKLGDQLIIQEHTFRIVGIGSTPDYDAVFEQMSDSSAESEAFGTAFVMKEDYTHLSQEGSSSKTEEYTYSYLLNGAMTDQELKKEIEEFVLDTEKVADSYFQEMLQKAEKPKNDIEESIMKLAEGIQSVPGDTTELYDGILTLKEQTEELAEEYFTLNLDNLTSFVTRENNMRIGASANDVIINKYAGMAAGVIVMTLFTYVISVFVVHGIERESSVIGALYALGVKRKQLLLHYLMLPVLVTFLGGAVGCILGFSPIGSKLQMQDAISYFSLPLLNMIIPIYLIIYGTIMPPVIAAIVNYFVISKKLRRTALSLIKNEQSGSRFKDFNLGKMGFLRRFQIRQLIRELRSGITVILGMFIALLVLMMGINCYALCINLREKSEADTKYEYMYTYKYPTDEVPEGGEAVYAEGLKREAYGFQLEVTVLGIDSDNPYFPVEVPENNNEITISDAVATKFRLEIGDKLVLTDDVKNQDYAFTVVGIEPYAVGLHAFLNIDSMRTLFEQEDNYYNMVLSDHKLDIDQGRLYATTSRADIMKGAEVFINMMWPLIITMSSVSAIVFVVVLYLMMKVMMDRSAFSISLMQIFGYRRKEIKKLYLDGNLFVISFGAVICIPLAKRSMDALYPYLISNVACGAYLSFSWYLYAAIFSGIILCYFLINQSLVGRIRKMLPAEVLKNRE